jgi:hypothetical protein
MKRARPGLRSRLRVALSAWLAAGALLCASGAAGAVSYPYASTGQTWHSGAGFPSDQSSIAAVRTLVESTWPGWTVRQVCGSAAVWTVWNGAYASSCIDTGLGYGAIYITAASCTTGDFLSTDKSECWGGASPAFDPADFALIFSTVFVASLSLYFVAYGIGLVIGLVKS